MLSSAEETLIREFSNIGAKAINRLKPIAEELKKYYINFEDFKNKEEDIKNLMRCGLTIEEQAFLTETDNYSRKGKTEEQAEKMKKRKNIIKRVLYLYDLLQKLIFPEFLTPEKKPREPRASSSGNRRKSSSSPHEEDDESMVVPVVIGDATPVENQYLSVPEEFRIHVFNPHKSKHEMDLPLRMCIVAPAGSGKTNFLVTLIQKFNPPEEQPTFDDIYIISPNANEPLFIYLKTLLGEGLFICDGLVDIPSIDDFDNNQQHLLCYDDCLNENQSSIIDFYVRGRNRNCSVIFLSQNYYGIEISIRRNTTYLVLLKLRGKKDVNSVLADYDYIGNQNIIRQMYNEAVSEKFGCFIIDIPRQEYRKNILGLYDLSGKSEVVRDDNQIVESALISVSSSLVNLLSEKNCLKFTLSNGRAISIWLDEVEAENEGEDEDEVVRGDEDEVVREDEDEDC